LAPFLGSIFLVFKFLVSLCLEYWHRRKIFGRS
jgi:hypothetical protein